MPSVSRRGDVLPSAVVTQMDPCGRPPLPPFATTPWATRRPSGEIAGVTAAATSTTSSAVSGSAGSGVSCGAGCGMQTAFRSSVRHRTSCRTIGSTSVGIRRAGRMRTIDLVSGEHPSGRVSGVGRAGEDVQVPVPAEAEPCGLGDRPTAPAGDRRPPRRDGSRSSNGTQLCESASISSPPAVSSSRIGVAQDAQSTAIGPVDAQLGKPPTRQPGGIDKSDW